MKTPEKENGCLRSFRNTVLLHVIGTCKYQNVNNTVIALLVVGLQTSRAEHRLRAFERGDTNSERQTRSIICNTFWLGQSDQWKR
jgi:hypothetical protein